MLWLSRLDQVEPAERARVLIWWNVCRRGGSPLQPSQRFVSHVNVSPRFKGNKWRVDSPRITWVGKSPLYQEQVFSVKGALDKP